MYHAEVAQALTRHVAVSRSDPIYGAHSYLTKVPVTAIRPFIEAFTEPGHVVLDPFAGSGMTGVAAAICGRKAVLRDINVLGRHIGTNYVNLVDPAQFRAAVEEAVARARQRVGDVYATRCDGCGKRAELSRTTWSIVNECRACGREVTFYRELERARWSKSAMTCCHCGEPFNPRGARRIGEEPVLDTVDCECERTLRDQPPGAPLHEPRIDGLTWPEVPIGAERQMFHASALGKHELTTTASFFSRRNLAALAALRAAIDDQRDPPLRDKLLFTFTAVLARASKRYQWSRKRPLNAANQHYYIAPVFYEWNVYDLFERKASAVMRSDDFLRSERRLAAFMRSDLGDEDALGIDYALGSADALDLADESIDYVFTDPPFGSNIFYSDMSLFHEAWLGDTTDHSREAVVDRSGDAARRRTPERYERLIAAALGECRRVLKPGGWLSLVFSNSSGAMWALVQRSLTAADFALDPDQIAVLDKGQRSVKGLASGFENIVTADLVLSMQKGATNRVEPIRDAPASFIDCALERALGKRERNTPTHVYLGVVREYLREGFDVGGIDMAQVVHRLTTLGYETHAASGTIALADAS